MKLINKIYNKLKKPSAYELAIKCCGNCGCKTIEGKHLIFISVINRDGSGTRMIDSDIHHLDDTEFKITCLSISNRTFIASEFNSYVVRLK